MKRILAALLSIWLLISAIPALGEATSTETASVSATATPDDLLAQWYALGDLLRQNGIYPYVVLSKGDTGYEVRSLQTRLAELGYYQKAVVDNFGSGTFSSLKQFEKANGLTADGEASVADQQLLYSDQAVSASAKPKSSGGNSSGRSSQTDATSSATSKK